MPVFDGSIVGKPERPTERPRDLSDLVDNRFLHLFRGRTGRIKHILHRLLDLPVEDRYVTVKTKNDSVLTDYLNNLDLTKGFRIGDTYFQPENLRFVERATPPARSHVYSK